MTSLRRRPPLLAAPVLAGTLLATLALAGCGAEPVPDQLAAPAALPSAPSDDTAGQPSREAAQPATVTPPADDAAAVPAGEEENEPTPAEVAEIEQFIRDYHLAMNEALVIADPERLAEFSIPECNCRSMVKFIEQNRGLGLVEGSRTTVHKIDVRDVGTEMASVVVDREAEDGRIVGPDGTTALVIDNGGRGSAVHALARTPAGWKVVQVLEL